MTTGIRFIQPYPVIVDANGVTVPGALAYFYVTGTSTPAPTYANVTLSVTNQNPVVANSAGVMPDIFLDPGIIYKLIMTDANGSVLWPVADPLEPALSVFTGSTNMADGKQGIVPAPLITEGPNGWVLLASGGWGVPYYVPSGAAPAYNAMGTLGAITRTITTNDALVINDCGQAIINGSNSPINLTVTKDVTANWPSGVITSILVINPSGKGVVSLVPDTGVTLLGPPSFTSSGTRALQAVGSAVLSRIAGNSWFVSGGGIS